MDGSVKLSVEPGHDVRGVSRRRWLSYVGRIVFAAVVVGAVALACAVTLVPAFSGATTLTVLSGSMQPALPVGSLVIVHPEPVDSIRTGDIITFRHRELGSSAVRLVTHRVVQVQHGAGLGFITRGDANKDPDQGVTAAADVQGVLWYHVPWMGSVREAIAGPVGMFYLAAALLLLVSGHYLTLGRSQSRASRR